eukprot:CAMPEP_0176074288 /NCGR_PEP_ID=MMETSP0120_2-20121206/37123_1 /TAXON_ID=160619 /ORGANISM="Kryptoperidinium foliaceum, Strain CCMP 1326" /LENGTH=234 /DNA_ID=CAMNT_0017407979 /DNA_START=9 /DNA_END=712 /DNA_ORIENTATION=+
MAVGDREGRQQRGGHKEEQRRLPVLRQIQRQERRREACDIAEHPCREVAAPPAPDEVVAQQKRDQQAGDRDVTNPKILNSPGNPLGTLITIHALASTAAGGNLNHHRLLKDQRRQEHPEDVEEEGANQEDGARAEVREADRALDREQQRRRDGVLQHPPVCVVVPEQEEQQRQRRADKLSDRIGIGVLLGEPGPMGDAAGSTNALAVRNLGHRAANIGSTNDATPDTAPDAKSA